MRVTICSGGGSELLALRDASAGDRVGDWLTHLKGWAGPPAPREGVTKRQLTNGDMWPSALTYGARTVTVGALICRGTTVALARAITSVGALAGRRLTLTVEGPDGPRSCDGYVSDDISPRYLVGWRDATLDIVMTCPDPLKYGRELAYTGTGAVTVMNAGDALTLPRVHADGPVTRLSLECGGRTVTWSGGADSLDLDFRDMVPSSGTVGVDNAFAIAPGENAVKVSTDAKSVTIYARPAWL